MKERAKNPAQWRIMRKIGYFLIAYVCVVILVLIADGITILMAKEPLPIPTPLGWVVVGMTFTGLLTTAVFAIAVIQMRYKETIEKYRGIS